VESNEAVSGVLTRDRDAETTPVFGRHSIGTVARPLAVPVVTIAIWYVLSWTIFVVPSPHGSVAELFRLLGTGDYEQQFLSTLGKTLVAFAVAAALGVVFGTLLGLVRPLREALEPLILIANGVPKIVLYPILLIIFGLGAASQTTMGIIFGTLPVLVNLMASLAAMRPVYRKVARMLEVGPIRALFRVYLPAVAPMLMVALQLGFGLSVLGVVYSELIASQHGIGQQLIESYSAGRYDAMGASILAILVIALGGTGLLRLCERLLFRAPDARGSRP
jgi:NitT/TauT family transport system permease protein